MSLHGSAIHSPSWDEVGHLAAGLEHWQRGTFELHKVNPPLPRAVAALPLLFTTNLRVTVPRPAEFPSRPEWKAGSLLIKEAGPRYFQLMTMARWMLLPVSLVGMWVCVRWARELGGNLAAVVAVWIWGVEPNIQTSTQLITPDLCATVAGVLLFWRARTWLISRTWNDALVVGFCLGMALLCKGSWLLAPPILLLAWCGWRISSREFPSLPREFGQLLIAFTLAVLVLNAGYGFSGSFQPLRKYTFFSSPLRPAEGTQPGNVFRGTAWGKLPVPFPKSFIEGIDFQRNEFERGLPSYLLGEHQHGGWWYFYLLALLWKVPIGLLCLAAAGLFSFLGRPRDQLRELWLILLPAVVLLGVVSAHTGFNHHLRYILPCFPAGVILASIGFATAFGSVPLDASRLSSPRPPDLATAEFRPQASLSHPAAVRLRFRHRLTSPAGLFAVLLLLWGLGASLAAHPHQMAYFNELAGGPDEGYLAMGLSAMDSLHDWQQDTLLLKRWVDDHPEFPLDGIALRGFPDLIPAAGLSVQTPPAGLALSELEKHPQDLCEVGPLPGRYALSLKSIFLPGSPYGYFAQLSPRERVGHTILIFDVSQVEAEHLWQKLYGPNASRDGCR